MSFLKKVSKAIAKATPKPIEKLVKKTTKMGLLDPLGLTQGKEKRLQRFRKTLRVGSGAAGGFIKGGIPGAFAGAAVAGYGASKKGQGDKAFTLGRGLKDFGSGYLAGMGTNAIASKMAAAPAMGSNLGLYQSGGALNASVPSSALTSTAGQASSTAIPSMGAKAVTSNWGTALAGETAKDVAKQVTLNQVTPRTPAYNPQESMYDPMAARASSDAHVQSMLDAYNKRKERYFYQ